MPVNGNPLLMAHLPVAAPQLHNSDVNVSLSVRRGWLIAREKQMVHRSFDNKKSGSCFVWENFSFSVGEAKRERRLSEVASVRGESL